MRAAIYRAAGDPDVLTVEDVGEPRPGPGEVRVRVAFSGVNPTDWKARRAGPGLGPGPAPARQVPHQDGSGTVDAVGDGVDPARVGERVWLWEAAWCRADGTAQEAVALPARQAVPLPEGASFELGAAVGIPALTAHRALTVREGGPERLAPGTLTGRTVLVAGGAGAVGHAAIELARWAGATVVTTVSSLAKAELARAAGAHHVVDYRAHDATDAIRHAAPDGVDVVVEVAPSSNAALDVAVLAPGGAVAIYADEAADAAFGPTRALMTANVRLQFVMVYTMPDEAKARAIAAVSGALADGALRVGEAAGLPLHVYPLAEVAAAQAAVEAGAVGKALVDVRV